MIKRILILDLDGVLITTPTWKTDEIDKDNYSKFNENCVLNLNQLLSDYTFEIWLSSTRRTVKSLSEFNTIFQNRGINTAICGFLPEYKQCKSRKEEIETFIEEKKITNFLIIDDDKSLNALREKNKSNLILTQLQRGFDSEKLSLAQSILSKKEEQLMKRKNCVFIATSLDGYIADKNGGIDWLHSIPNPKNDDMGYFKFIDTIDAIVMGKTTFETVSNFDIDWPYTIPVFVLSTTLDEIPLNYKDKVFLLKGNLTSILSQIHNKGHYRLYIDGGTTIQNFLKEDLIDEMTITTIPILLGGGYTLFSDLPNAFAMELIGSKTYLGQIVQNHYRRKYY